MIRLLQLLCALSVIVVIISPLAAQEGASDPIARGVALRRQGRNAEALVEFQRAYARDPSPRALAQIALAQQALGNWVVAESGLVDALTSREDPWIQRSAGALQAALETIRDHLARLYVESDVAGASVLLDGRIVGTTPLSAAVRVPVGRARVEARAPGYETRSTDVDFTARGDHRVRLDLSRATNAVARGGAPGAPAAALPAAGASGGAGSAFGAQSAQSSHLGVDASSAALASARTTDVPQAGVAGATPSATRLAPMISPLEGTVAPSAHAEKTNSPPTAAAPSSRGEPVTWGTPHTAGPSDQPSSRGGSGLRTAGVIALIAGGVFVAGGVTAHAIREHYVSQYNDESFCTPHEDCSAYPGAANTARTWAIAGYVAGGAALVTGLVLIAVAPSRSRSGLSLSTGPNGVDVRWRGRF